MTEHLGVIRLDDNEVAVAVEIAPNSIKLVTDKLLVGDWTPDQCRIVRNGAGGFSIEAEGDSLEFEPIDASAFEAALATRSGEMDHPPIVLDGIPKAVAPRPKPMTLVLFVALLALTLILGVWATWTLLT